MKHTGLWINRDETVEVEFEGPDADGDYEVRPVGTTRDEAWTTYRRELEDGTVRLEIECYNCGNRVGIGQRHDCPAFKGEVA